MKEKNRNYSYVVDHDIGYAPNPYFEYLTLAGCKPSMNKKKGLRAYINQDWLEQEQVWVIGTAGKYLILEDYEYKNDKLQKLATGIDYRYRLIFALQVKEIKCFNDYFHDERFKDKKLGNISIKMYGDNHIHYKNNDVNSEKYISYSIRKVDNYIRSNEFKVGCDKVLISAKNDFYYFGCFAPNLGTEFSEIIKSGQNCLTFSELNAQKLKMKLKEITNEKGIFGFPSFNKNKKYKEVADNEEYLIEIYKNCFRDKIKEELTKLFNFNYEFKNPTIKNVLKKAI